MIHLIIYLIENVSDIVNVFVKKTIKNAKHILLMSYDSYIWMNISPI